MQPAAVAPAAAPFSAEEQQVLDFVKELPLSPGAGGLPPAKHGWRAVTDKGVSSEGLGTDASDKRLYTPGVALISRGGNLALAIDIDCDSDVGADSPELDARALAIARDKLGGGAART